MTARRRRTLPHRPRKHDVPIGRRLARCPACNRLVVSDLPATIPAGQDQVQSVVCPGCEDVILFRTDGSPVLLPASSEALPLKARVSA